MKVFKDALDRAHNLVITVGTLKVVKDALGVDLWRAFDDEAKVLQELLADPIRFTEAVYVLCGGRPKDDAAEAEFCRGVDGDTLDRMATAFREELVDFYPPPRRPLLRRMIEKGAQVTEALQQKVSRRVDELTPEAVLERMAGKGSAGVSQVSSESTPGPTPSAS